jgi:hypothetical protein
MRRADNLTTLVCQLSRNSGSLNFQEPKEPVQACKAIALPCVEPVNSSLHHKWEKPTRVYTAAAKI